jgi:2'-hydroxyisoflavone reductase
VIDNPTTLPSWVRNVAQYMKDNTDHYIFISTISVYPDNSKPDADETAPLTPVPEGIDPYTITSRRRPVYGALKSVSEGEVEKQYPGKNTIIAGAHRRPARPQRSIHLLAVPHRQGRRSWRSGTPNDPVQLIDARDIAEWTIRVAENRTLGIYNTTGPNPPMTMGQMLEGSNSDRLEGDLHVGPGRFSRGAEDRVEQHASVASAVRRPPASCGATSQGIEQGLT